MQSLSLISDSLYIDCVYLSYLNTHIILDRPDRPQPCKIRGGLKLILTVSGPQAPSSWSPVNCVHVNTNYDDQISNKVIKYWCHCVYRSILGAALERKSVLLFDAFNGKMIAKKTNAHTDCVNCVK